MRDFQMFFPEVHAMIAGTDADPTGNDSRIPAFWEAVKAAFDKHYHGQ